MASSRTLLHLNGIDGTSTTDDLIEQLGEPFNIFNVYSGDWFSYLYDFEVDGVRKGIEFRFDQNGSMMQFVIRILDED